MLPVWVPWHGDVTACRNRNLVQGRVPLPGASVSSMRSFVALCKTKPGLEGRHSLLKRWVPRWLDLLLVGLGPQLSPRTAPSPVSAAGVVMGHWDSGGGRHWPCRRRQHCQGQRPLQTRRFMKIQFSHDPSVSTSALDGVLTSQTGTRASLVPFAAPPEPSLSPAGEGVCDAVRNPGHTAAALLSTS